MCVLYRKGGEVPEDLPRLLGFRSCTTAKIVLAGSLSLFASLCKWIADNV